MENEEETTEMTTRVTVIVSHDPSLVQIEHGVGFNWQLCECGEAELQVALVGDEGKTVPDWIEVIDGALLALKSAYETQTNNELGEILSSATPDPETTED